ncbi:MAG: DUF2807 domain-containing protein [Flavobacteriales bacterium]|nr:DUF2807 domain-containing protein [Flavobacteriales bacterium]
MNAGETDKTFDVLRELPVELSVEQVGGMVATFTLTSSAGSWFSNINLNSILMTSAGAMIIAGSIYFLGPNDQGPGTPRTPTPVAAPLVELDEASVVEEPVGRAPVPLAPVPEATPVKKEDKVEAAEVADPPTDFNAFVQPVPTTPPGRRITIVTAAPGMASLQNCVLAVEPDGSLSGREFEISGFTGVSVLGALDVVLEQGDFSVKAEGDEKQIDRLDLSVKDGSLVIGTKAMDGRNRYNSQRSVVVKVYLPVLERIALAGSGDVAIGNFAGTEKVHMDLQGSGDIHFDSMKGLTSLSIDLDGSGDIVGENVEVGGTTEISVSGSGDVRIVGHTDVLKVEVVGSGDVDASEMEARDCEGNLTGSGGINLNCKGRLRTSTTGSGSIDNLGDADGGDTGGKGSHSN